MPERSDSVGKAREGGDLGRTGQKTRSALRSLSFKEALLVVVVAALLHGALHFGVGLYDTDGYTHLGLARTYAEEGIPHRVETARFSVMHEGFGDKEWLFHALLVPAVLWFSPLVAGHVALIVFNVLLSLVLASIGRFLVGRWGLLLPFLLPLLSLETAWRLVRLRPELLAMSLLLVALVCLAERRPWALFATTFVFTWSYTAFHALLGVLFLASILLLVGDWSRRDGLDRRSLLRLFLAPPLGAVAGLVLHPHFPHNLTIWLIQNVQFFRAKNVLDAGTEIRPNLTSVMLQANLGWWLALIVFLGAVAGTASRPKKGQVGRPGLERYTRLTIVFGAAAASFGVLYLLMSRFSLYAFPLTTLALLSGARACDWSFGRRFRTPGLGSVPSRPLVAVVVLVALVLGAREWTRFRARTDLGPDRVRIAEWQRIDGLLPSGARVAADWRTTGVLGYWAPARYLNLLDPVFMAQAHPERHTVLRAVLAGDEPDVVAALRGPLDSEFLVVSVARATPHLLARLRSDPRLDVLHDGTYLLVRDASRDRRSLDWLADGWAGLEQPTGESGRGDADVEASATGFVGGRGRLSEGDCFTVQRRISWPSEAVGLEFAPNGPGRLTWNQQVLISLPKGVRAIHGHGVRLPVPRTPAESFKPADADEGHLEVTTCRPENGTRPGFYLRVLAP